MLDHMQDYPPENYGKCWRNMGRVDQIEALQLAEEQLRSWCQVYPSMVEEEDNYALEAIRSALQGIDGEDYHPVGDTNWYVLHP